MKLERILADKQIDISEAAEIEQQALEDGPDAISEKAATAVANALKNKDISVVPEARSKLERLIAMPVRPAAPPNPTERTKLFQSDEPLSLTLKADFTSLFAQKREEGRTKGFSGVLEMADGDKTKTITVQVRTRGQSSLTYLPEPKLKMKLDATERKGSIFKKEGSLEIGVQGGASGKDGLGRVLIPEAPPREAATYALLEEMGLCVPRARVANFDYIDTPTNTVRKQPAFLNEDADSLAKRYFGDGGVEAGNNGNADQITGLQATLKTADVIRLHMGLMLVGNNDYAFRVEGDFAQPTVVSTGGMHNTKMIMKPAPGDATKGDAIPVATDFDLSLFVLQTEYKGYAKNAWHPTNYTADLQDMRTRFAGPAFKEVLNDVLARQDKMNARLAQYPLDQPSKDFIKTQLDTFFTAVKAELAL